ncbi:FAD-dependent oxidoreductase [Deltaproteobacteria bacterium]|nr:FAD-dependent oxidoreductase [Deltaproteobacteria bacterium]
MSSKGKEIKTGLVIIGGGGAGLAAAVAAAEKGAKDIVILESRHVPGGNAAFVMGILAAESRLQKRMGFEARRDDIFRIAMDYAHWKINPRLIRSLVDKSGDTIEWLEEKGLKFEQILIHAPNQVPPTFHRIGGSGKTGAEVVRALVKSCEDFGVQILCQTRAKHLLTDKDGHVVGVLAESKDNEIIFTAESVIIATGGFAGNSDMLNKYLPDYNEEEFHYAGIPHKGEGLLMATEIGAATDGMVVLEMNGPDFPGSSYMSVVASQPNTLWLNKKGERFTDETVSFLFSQSANTLYRQPDKISYTLFDERIKQNIFKEELYPIDKSRLNDTNWPARVDKDLQLHSDKGRVKISDSLDEIAKWIGIDPEMMKAEVDEYNSFCDQGHDNLFAKDRMYLLPLRTPPYYAIQCCITLLTTHGGIKINHHMEVVDKQDNPIPGLYAAGVETGSNDSGTYNAHIPGHSFGFTVNSGRIAGENATIFALAKKH